MRLEKYAIPPSATTQAAPVQMNWGAMTARALLEGSTIQMYCSNEAMVTIVETRHFYVSTVNAEIPAAISPLAAPLLVDVIAAGPNVAVALWEVYPS